MIQFCKKSQGVPVFTKKFCDKIQNMVKKKCHGNDYEDVSQEIFLRMHTISADDIQDEAKYHGAIVKNRLKTHHSKKIIQGKKFPTISLSAINDKSRNSLKDSISLESILIQQEMDAIVWECMERLSAKDQDILVAYYYKGISPSVYAEQNHISCRAVLYRRKAALANLGKELLKYEDFQPQQ